MEETSLDQQSVEQWVMEVMRELKLPASTPDVDFFAAGGTSIGLIRLVARAETAFGVSLQLDPLLDSSSVRSIAEIIREGCGVARA
jgi:acyl carrier protein